MLGWYRWRLLLTRLGPLVPSLHAIGTVIAGTVGYFGGGTASRIGIPLLELFQRLLCIMIT